MKVKKAWVSCLTYVSMFLIKHLQIIKVEHKGKKDPCCL